ncbi:hypothetical protein PR048_004683, partial [Dryococelus australis]
MSFGVQIAKKVVLQSQGLFKYFILEHNLSISMLIINDSVVKLYRVIVTYYNNQTLVIKSSVSTDNAAVIAGVNNGVNTLLTDMHNMFVIGIRK